MVIGKFALCRQAKRASPSREQPTHFKFAVSLNTAGALGLAIPPAILGPFDEVID